MAHVTPDISKGQVVVYSFGQDALAASQTDVQLSVVVGEASQTVDSVVAPWDFDIIAVAGTTSAAATAGTLTVGATINGTEDTDSTVTVTTLTEFRQRIKRGLMRGVAGDNIGAEITTGGTWDGTTADLSTQVYVLYYLEGI